MTPLDLNQLPITIPIGEEGDQDYKFAHDPSFFSCPNFFASGGAYDHGADCAQQLHQETKGHSLMANEGDTTNTKIKLTWYKRYAQEEASQGGSNKWIMKKTTNSGQFGAETRGNMIKESDDIQGQNQTKSSTAGLIRVCSDCNTTRTPLWRGGPRGPKSLCNACGIRQRKARRSAEAAAAAATAAINGAAPPKIRKEKKSGVLRAAALFKKRCEMIAGCGATGGAPLKQLRFDDVKISLSGAASSGLVHERFPQDEREAAILLMALSCGLVRS